MVMYGGGSVGDGVCVWVCTTLSRSTTECVYGGVGGWVRGRRSVCMVMYDDESVRDGVCVW